MCLWTKSLKYEEICHSCDKLQFPLSSSGLPIFARLLHFCCCLLWSGAYLTCVKTSQPSQHSLRQNTVSACCLIVLDSAMCWCWCRSGNEVSSLAEVAVSWFLQVNRRCQQGSFPQLHTEWRAGNYLPSQPDSCGCTAAGCWCLA